MTRQYLRSFTLLVATGSGKALDLSELRCEFSVKKANDEKPNTCEVSVYNLSADTSLQIEKEFTEIILQAGYGGNTGVIFRGNIIQVLRGRENQTDSYLSIIAADGDTAYNFAVVSTTLAAGAAPGDEVAAAMRPMNSRGVTAGSVPNLGGQRLTRGRVMFGNSREYMRQSADSTGHDWSIQDGKLQFVPRGGVLPGQAIVLTSDTGLIGTPEQSNDGIKTQCLINPMIKPGGVVDIRTSEVKAAKAGNFVSAPNKAGTTDERKPVRIDPDGLYKVLRIEYEGDTHGQPWYMTLITVGIDDTAPATKKVKI